MSFESRPASPRTTIRIWWYPQREKKCVNRVSIYPNIEEKPKIIQLPKVIRILEGLSSGRGNLPIILVIKTFHGCLANGDAPQLPCEQRTNSKAHHETHEVNDSEEDRRRPILPGVIKMKSKSRGYMAPAKNNKAEGSYCDVYHEHDKMTFIIEADTLVYPRAMVVKLQHATITHSTMM